MSPLRHWHETNPGAEPKPAPKQSGRGRGNYHHGPKAKPIHYEGRTYTTFAEACAATGKTKDAIRWAIKRAR